MTHSHSMTLPGITPKISKRATVQSSVQTVLFRGRLYGGFVNSAVSVKKEIIFKVVVFSIVDLNLSNTFLIPKENIHSVFSCT